MSVSSVQYLIIIGRSLYFHVYTAYNKVLALVFSILCSSRHHREFQLKEGSKMSYTEHIEINRTTMRTNQLYPKSS